MDADVRLARLEARLDALEAENRQLRAAAAPPAPAAAAPVPTAAAPPPTPQGAEGPAALGRRGALKQGLGLAGAAAAGAVLLDGAPAAAANGSAIIIGASNDGASGTTLVHTGTSGYGLFVASASTTGAGIRASGPPNGGALSVYGGKYHMQFEVSSGRVPPPQEAGRVHQRGEVVIDAYSNLWFCNGDGAPGRWRTLAGNGSTGAFYPFSTPVRAYDSRPGTSPALGPKTKLNGQRVLSLRAETGLNTYATGVLVNVLLVNANAGSGNFTIWQFGLPKPASNTLVWGGSAGRFSTFAFTNVDQNGNVNIHSSLPTDVVVDVIGWFM